MKLLDEKIINGNLIAVYKTGEKGDRRFVVMVVDQRNIALFKSLMLSEQRRKLLLKSLCLVPGTSIVLFFCWFWQAWTIDNFGPTGLYRHMPHVYDIWICLFLDIFWLALGIIITFLVTCYPFLFIPLSQVEKESQC